jgi:hypothetical protein
MTFFPFRVMMSWFFECVQRSWQCIHSIHNLRINSSLESKAIEMKRGTCQSTNKRRKRLHESIFWKATLLAFGLCCSINTSDALQVQIPVKRGVERFDRMDQLGLAEPLRPRTNEDSSLSLKTPQYSKTLRAGAASSLVLALILGLAIKDSQGIGSDELAISAVSNVFDAAMPSSSTDLVAGAIGESIGGSCGAAATVVLTSLMNVSGNSTKSVTNSEVTNAIADTDFFIVSSASLPLLLAFGLPPALATVGSVVFAAIPSQLVKLGQRMKERRFEEETVLKQLLNDAQLLQKNRRPTFRFPSPFRKEEETKKEDLSPVTTETPMLDQVEIFADVTRWLEYGVLKTEFAGTIVLDGMILSPGQTGAVLGIFAAVSSQFYADVLYGRLFESGPKSKQEEVASRSTSDWVRVYASKAAASAALFGVYEQSQIPISRWIQGTLAGGVDGCIGSTSFEMCLQTYIDSNSPGASPEAQARALLTNLVMLGQRLEDIAGDTTWDDMNSLLGAWAVSANSYIQHL